MTLVKDLEIGEMYVCGKDVHIRFYTEFPLSAVDTPVKKIDRPVVLAKAWYSTKLGFQFPTNARPFIYLYTNQDDFWLGGSKRHHYFLDGDQLFIFESLSIRYLTKLKS